MKCNSRAELRAYFLSYDEQVNDPRGGERKHRQQVFI